MNETMSLPYSAEDLLLRGPYYFADIRFVEPSWAEIEHTRAWLSQVLRIDVPENSALPAQEAHACAKVFVSQLGAWCQQLLVLGRIPMFAAPRVLSWQWQKDQPGAHGVKLGFEVLDHVAWDNYLFVLNFALSRLLQLAKLPITAVNKQDLFDSIERQVMHPLQQVTSTGKSTMPVLAQAHVLGIPWVHLGIGVYQLGWGSLARRMDRSSIDQDSAIGSRLVQNKVTCAALLRMASLPAPVHEVVGDVEKALKAAQKLAYPVVVKPTDRDRGEGITVDVNNDAALRLAFEHAHALAQNKQVIVERQAEGVCHRVFVAHGEILYAVKRLPMSVFGDGVQTVSQLVQSQWEQQQALPPWQRSELQLVDDLAVAEMARAGWQPDAVPGVDVRVPLRRIESTQWGGVDEEVTDAMHPDNRAIAILAAKVCGLAVAGVDIITTDLAVPWHTSGAIINEVNYAPLLGGGEISRRHIPTYLRALIPNNGQIPVEIIRGSDAEEKARLRQVAYAQQGVRAFVASQALARDPDGVPVPMTAAALPARIKALLCRQDVDALLIVQ